MKWEYKIVYVADDSPFEGQLTYEHEKLNALGDEGWELMGVKGRLSPSSGSNYIFKRLKGPM